MDILPNEIVLNEILKAMDQRTALNFLMSSPKYRHIVMENIEKYFPSDKYYNTEDDNILERNSRYRREEDHYPNGIDIRKLVIEDAVINVKKFVIDGKLTVKTIIRYAQLMDNFELFEEYKNFIGVYGKYKDSNIHFGINTDFIRDYVYTKLENRQYDSSLRILKSLLNDLEEKVLFVNEKPMVDMGYDDITVYQHLLERFLSNEYYDIVTFILDHIFVSEIILNYVIDRGDLHITKYAFSRYIQDGGSLDSISVGTLVGAPLYCNVSMKYIPIFRYFLTLPKNYDFKYLYNGIIENEDLHDDVRNALLEELKKYL